MRRRNLLNTLFWRTVDGGLVIRVTIFGDSKIPQRIYGSLIAGTGVVGFPVVRISNHVGVFTLTRLVGVFKPRTDTTPAFVSTVRFIAVLSDSPNSTTTKTTRTGFVRL